MVGCRVVGLGMGVMGFRVEGTNRNEPLNM